MPHGAPKRLTAFRIEPELLDAVRVAAKARGTNVTAVIEECLRRWLKRVERKAVKGDPLAKYLYPPTPREIAGRPARKIAVRRKGDAA